MSHYLQPQLSDNLPSAFGQFITATSIIEVSIDVRPTPIYLTEVSVGDAIIIHASTMQINVGECIYSFCVLFVVCKGMESSSGV